MKKIIRLTESDLNRIIKRVINEQPDAPIRNEHEIYVRPGITIDCKYIRILKSDLPASNLDGDCNRKIISHFCKKYKPDLETYKGNIWKDV